MSLNQFNFWFLRIRFSAKQVFSQKSEELQIMRYEMGADTDKSCTGNILLSNYCRIPTPLKRINKLVNKLSFF